MLMPNAAVGQHIEANEMNETKTSTWLRKVDLLPGGSMGEGVIASPQTAADQKTEMPEWGD